MGSMPTVGLIAEEVAVVYPDAVTYRDGKPFSIKNSMLITLLIQRVNELEGMIN